MSVGLRGDQLQAVNQPVRGIAVHESLLACGILSSLLYAAMNVVVPMRWDGYSSASQAVSELSAIGAPTRPLWIVLGFAYTVLVVAFGLGVRRSARDNRRLTIAADAILAFGAMGLLWFFAPMHLRGAERTPSDTMHIALAMLSIVLMMAAMGFGAAALGGRFRAYSLASLTMFVALGIPTAVDGVRLARNLPTPWLGVWERLEIGVFLLWIAVLAVALLRARGRQDIARAPSSERMAKTMA